MWESCWTMPFVGWFSWGSPVSPNPFIPALFHTHLSHPHRLSRPRQGWRGEEIRNVSNVLWESSSIGFHMDRYYLSLLNIVREQLALMQSVLSTMDTAPHYTMCSFLKMESCWVGHHLQEDCSVLNEAHPEYSTTELTESDKGLLEIRIKCSKEHQIGEKDLAKRVKEIYYYDEANFYFEYTAKYPDEKLGIAKFCELFPKECITIKSRGIHSACVSTRHQMSNL
ncbi:hypothetical protein PR048_001529 [Dryococelus australis]|uniref:Uncharacterized protein n=1 Tax=Dryococelus australis TaxID=614101 RepID=A0ABQ9IHQ6_9NEOP|nr:hypothetical protein PR048_001529 [Dryococelus australis]